MHFNALGLGLLGPSPIYDKKRPLLFFMKQQNGKALRVLQFLVCVLYTPIGHPLTQPPLFPLALYMYLLRLFASLAGSGC